MFIEEKSDYDDEDTLFQISKDGVSKMLPKLIAAAPSGSVNMNITAHSFRRSFATTHSRNGTSINVLAKLMGHKSISTT